MSRMLQAPLQAPRPALDAITAADEYAELLAQRKDALIDEAMSGFGNFWNLDLRDPDSYDCEQYVDLFPVIAAMMRLPNTTDEAKWRGLMMAVRGLAQEYAERRCER